MISTTEDVMYLLGQMFQIYKDIISPDFTFVTFRLLNIN